MIAFLFLISWARFVFSTNIATFSDSNCKNSFRDLSGPDGFPDGTCTLLNSVGPFNSFQVVDMDLGCTGLYYHRQDSVTSTD
jgi:hypothetical protein